MSKIIGFGNALVDALVLLEDEKILKELQFPKGSMQLIDESLFQTVSNKLSSMNPHYTTGGSAGNTLLALTNLGTDAAFIGKVGNDKYGKFYTDFYTNLGIEAKLLQSEHPTGVASTFITPDGERTFGTFLGAAALLEAKDLTPDLFDGYSFLYVEGYLVQNHDMILRAMELAHAAGLKICIDMASYNIVEADLDFFQHLITNYVDIVFANEEEARAFTGGLEPQEALEEIARLCEVAVVKVGSKGALASDGNDTVYVSAIEVEKVLDTTAAGDYFSGGFLHAYLKGHSLAHCTKIGTLLASEIIQVVGTALPDEKWNEIKLNVHSILGE